jgi:hypothetical protein
LFTRGKIKEVELKRKFLSKLRPKVRKLCIVQNCANMEALLAIALEVEKVLGELRETPFNPFKEQEEFMIVANVMVEK